MDNFTNNILVANALIDADRNHLLSGRNRLLQELSSQLHLDLKGVNNSIQAIGDNLRKKKYVLVDFFYNVYDEIIQMKFNEQEKCFMLFGIHHSWKIYITDMDEYTFGRLKTKLTYSELYDTLITLEDLIGEFDIGYSMDTFDSVISKRNVDELNLLIKAYDDLKEEGAFELEKTKKALANAETQLKIYKNMRNEVRALPEPVNKKDLVLLGIVVTVNGALIVVFSILAAFYATEFALVAILFTVIFFLFAIGGLGKLSDARFLKSLDYDPAQKLKLALAGIEDMEKKIDILKTGTLPHVKDEYDAKIASADAKVKDFVDSFRR